MARDIEMEKCMDFWDEVFARDEREDSARRAADARLRKRER